MHKVVRTFIDACFSKSVRARFPDFSETSSKSWAGLARGATFQKAQAKTGPSIFILINYQSDRERVFPFLAWSQSAKLPDDSAEDECQRLLRVGSSVSEVLRLPAGILDPSSVGAFSNCFESDKPLFTEAEARTFLADERVRSFLQLYVDYPLSVGDPIPAIGTPSAAFFAYDAVAGLAPGLMTEEIMSVAYGSIASQLEKWLAVIEPFVRLKEGQGAA